MTEMRSPPQNSLKTSLPTQVPKGRSPQNLLTQPLEATLGPREGIPLHLPLLEKFVTSGPGTAQTLRHPLKGTPSGKPQTLSEPPSGPLRSWHPKKSPNPRAKGASKNF